MAGLLNAVREMNEECREKPPLSAQETLSTIPGFWLMGILSSKIKDATEASKARVPMMKYGTRAR